MHSNSFLQDNEKTKDFIVAYLNFGEHLLGIYYCEHRY